MKAHIVQAVASVNHASQNVVGGVLLSVVKPAGQIHLAPHLRARQQRLLQPMQDAALLFLHIEHLQPVQRPTVAGLSTALGIKRRAIQHNIPAVFCLTAFQHFGCKGT